MSLFIRQPLTSPRAATLRLDRALCKDNYGCDTQITESTLSGYHCPYLAIICNGQPSRKVVGQMAPNCLKCGIVRQGLRDSAADHPKGVT